MALVFFGQGGHSSAGGDPPRVGPARAAPASSLTQPLVMRHSIPREERRRRRLIGHEPGDVQIAGTPTRPTGWWPGRGGRPGPGRRPRRPARCRAGTPRGRHARGTTPRRRTGRSRRRPGRRCVQPLWGRSRRRRGSRSRPAGLPKVLRTPLAAALDVAVVEVLARVPRPLLMVAGSPGSWGTLVWPGSCIVYPWSWRHAQVLPEAGDAARCVALEGEVGHDGAVGADESAPSGPPARACRRWVRRWTGRTPRGSGRSGRVTTGRFWPFSSMADTTSGKSSGIVNS